MKLECEWRHARKRWAEILRHTQKSIQIQSNKTKLSKNHAIAIRAADGKGSLWKENYLLSKNAIWQPRRKALEVKKITQEFAWKPLNH